MLVTLQTFDNSASAHILKSKLESESILCNIKDENMASTYHYQGAPSIEIQVVNKDYKEAEEILKNMGYNIGSSDPEKSKKDIKYLLILFGVILILSLIIMINLILK